MSLQFIRNSLVAAAAAFVIACGPPPTTTDSGTPDTDAGPQDAGDDVDAGPVDAGPFVTAQTYCDELAVRICDYRVRCIAEAPAPADNVRILEAQRELCIARESASPACRARAHAWESGRIDMDLQALANCLGAKYPKDTCERHAIDYAPACAGEPWIHPMVAVGGACLRDDECQNSYCSSANTPACGVCTAYRAAGTECFNNRDIECDPNQGYCAVINQNQDRECVAYRNVGQSCSGSRADFICGPGRVCTGTGMNQNCQVAKTEGESCISGRYECGRFVDPDAITVVHWLMVCSTPSSGTTGSCIRGESNRGDGCETSERTLRGGTGSRLGPTCSEFDTCVSNICTEKTAAGGSCIISAQCIAGNRCQLGTCAPHAADGESCTPSTTVADCAGLLECIGGACQPSHVAMGGTCNTNTECAEGFCASDTCVALGEAGEACSENAACRSGGCDAGLCDEPCGG